MTINPTPEKTPGARAWAKVRELGKFWVQFTVAAAALTLLFGPFGPVIVMGFALTFGLPVLALVVWGQSLDEELGWSELDEGPW